MPSFLLVLLLSAISVAAFVLYVEASVSDVELQPKGGRLEANRTYYIVVTDPHGWYTGHRHSEAFDADYASLSSFADKLREQAKKLENCFVYLFENGDLVDGGGLTDEHPEGKRRTLRVLDDIGFDARTFGNHELYDRQTVESFSNLPGKFVTSNIVRSTTKQPYGARYALLPHRGKEKILVFGFLYNMAEYDRALTLVETVENSVQSDWFRSALEEPNVNSIVVLAHMHYKDPLVYVILEAIRKIKPKSLPVVFMTGHTHLRRSAHLDPNAFTFETGRFMDTVGVISRPTIVDPRNSEDDETNLDFKREYLDCSKEVLSSWLHSSQETDKAIEIRERFAELRKEFGLDKTIGFAPFTLSINVGLDNPFSLVQYWVSHVVPHTLLNRQTECPGFFIGGSGSLRYDLLAGFVKQDDVWAMAPFQEGYRVVRCLRGDVLLDVVGKLPKLPELLGSYARPFHPSLPTFVYSSLEHIHREKSYDLVFGVYEASIVLDILKGVAEEQLTDAPFRENEGLNGHTLWVKYFESRYINLRQVFDVDLM